MHFTYVPEQDLSWVDWRAAGSAYIASTFRTIAINEKWNEQHIVNWISKPESETHDVSAIEYSPMNNTNGLSVTKNGNLVFSKKDNKVFVITAKDAPKERIVLCKYRMMYDIFLLYESHGYRIDEYLIDECPASTCIPCRPDQPHQNRPTLRDERVEDVLSRARPRRRRCKTQKADDFKDHPLQADHKRKLLAGRAYKVSHRKRDKYRQYDRSYKCSERSVWNITEEALPETMGSMFSPFDDWRYDDLGVLYAQNNWSDGDDEEEDVQEEERVHEGGEQTQGVAVAAVDEAVDLTQIGYGGEHHPEDNLNLFPGFSIFDYEFD